MFENVTLNLSKKYIIYVMFMQTYKSVYKKCSSVLTSNQLKRRDMKKMLYLQIFVVRKKNSVHKWHYVLVSSRENEYVIWS